MNFDVKNTTYVELIFFIYGITKRRTAVRIESKNQTSLNNISIAVIFNSPIKLERNYQFNFPLDAEAEWETQQTIDKIEETWTNLGCHVKKMPLDKNFLQRWAQEHHEIDLVHSLVEGWGSVSREGWIPALCELSGTPFIGSGAFAQCIAMKKSALKAICRELSIPTADYFVVDQPEDIEQIPDSFLEISHFIKPNCEGSGMGIDRSHSIGNSPKSSRDVCHRLLEKYPEGILVETLLTGRELTSARVGSGREIVLPIAEIEVPDGVYGLSYKGKDKMEEKVSFPKLPKATEDLIHSAMSTLARRVGFEDFVRFDWKLNPTGVPVLLEANPLAGLSYYYSVLPKMAEKAGLNYSELMEQLAASALSRRESKRFWYGRSRVNSGY